jgi:hypothetical protein
MMSTTADLTRRLIEAGEVSEAAQLVNVMRTSTGKVQLLTIISDALTDLNATRMADDVLGVCDDLVRDASGDPALVELWARTAVAHAYRGHVVRARVLFEQALATVSESGAGEQVWSLIYLADMINEALDPHWALNLLSRAVEILDQTSDQALESAELSRDRLLWAAARQFTAIGQADRAARYLRQLIDNELNAAESGSRDLIWLADDCRASGDLDLEREVLVAAVERLHVVHAGTISAFETRDLPTRLLRSGAPDKAAEVLARYLVEVQPSCDVFPAVAECFPDSFLAALPTLISTYGLDSGPT